MVDRNHHKDELVAAAKEALDKALSFGFDALLEMQKQSWAQIWKMSDITIEGDVKAQQGIRFNIFQLNQSCSDLYLKILNILKSLHQRERSHKLHHILVPC